MPISPVREDAAAEVPRAADFPTGAGFRLNIPPNGTDAQKLLGRDFLEFLEPLHRRFTPWQQDLVRKRREVLRAAHAGRLPNHLPASQATRDNWRIELPDWSEDQRNQMTGPADDADLCVKMLNSGAPGVMLDLEDSMANAWEHLMRGIENILSALRGDLSYFDQKRQQQVGIKPSKTVTLLRVRGLHLHQGGIFGGEVTAAPLFDVASIVHRLDPGWLRHPLTFYLPKSESAEEALWWRDLFQAVAHVRGWPHDAIKCMALVESHPLAYQMEEFLYHLREHILALNLGRWDYMASLIHFNFEDPAWVLPDRNTIPHDAPFFQRLRELMPEICHRRGALAIGGMTALYPSREDPELNAMALKVLEEDKRNESRQLMDGAWTGHPDQNQIAVDQFPHPNQLHARRGFQEEDRVDAGDPARGDGNVSPIPRCPDLRPRPESLGTRSVAGTRAAVRTVIRYRNGVLNGKGASLLDGYMEDLATDRIYRLMLAQRLRHSDRISIAGDDGTTVAHTREFLRRIFDEELEKLLDQPPKDVTDAATVTRAREIAESMVLNGEFDPF